MNFHVLTLFPEMIRQGLSESIIGRAAEKGLIFVNPVNIRDFTRDIHRKVDDYPYGGGAGLLMQAQPVCDAHRYVREQIGRTKKVRTIYLTPQGRTFDQRMAEELAEEEELIFLCGHYEGIDERALEQIVTDPVSLGDFVLTGGELPAMVMIDAISRLVPGVLHNDSSATEESFSGYLLEYPQYTRPEVFEGKAVPGELLTGNHRLIQAWRRKQAEERTAVRRPDLYARYAELLACEQQLLKNKLLHRDMLELISRGRAELVCRGADYAVLRDRRSGIYEITAAHGSEQELAVIEEALQKEQKMGRTISCVMAHQQAIGVRLEEAFALKQTRCFTQWVYTRKEVLPVRGADVRRLTRAQLPEIQAYAAALTLTEKQLAERLDAGAVLGIFAEGKLAGFAGEYVEGGMGMLYVRPRYREKGFARALESSLINQTLQRGYTPFCQVEEGNQAISRIQEKLGLYPAAGRVWQLEPVPVPVKK